jgi:hypothetical protein
MILMMTMVVLVNIRNFHNQVNLIGILFLSYLSIFSIVNFNFLLTHAALNHQAKGKPDASRLAIDMTQLTLKKMSLGNLLFWFYHTQISRFFFNRRYQ